MRRYSSLSALLLLSGVTLICLSGMRWLVIYSDHSSAYFGMILGALLIFCGYLNQRVSDLSEGQQEIHRGFDSFNNWVVNKFKGRKK